MTPDEGNGKSYDDSENPGGEEPVTPPEPGDEGAARDGGSPQSNVHELPPRDGRPLADKAGEEEQGEEEDGQQTFEVFDGREEPKLGVLVKRGTPVEIRIKMTGKSIPGVKGGLIDPYSTSIPLLADCVVDDNDTQYIRDDNGAIEKAIVYMTLKPRRVADLRTEQGQAWLQEMNLNAA